MTRQHVSQLASMLTGLPDSQPVLDSIKEVEGLLANTYGQLGMGATHLLRQTLLRFFQDRRIKVSLFLQARPRRVTLFGSKGRGAAGVTRLPSCLPACTHCAQEGIQSTTGRLIIVNPGSSRAGTVTYYDGNGGLEAQERIKLKALDVSANAGGGLAWHGGLGPHRGGAP